MEIRTRVKGTTTVRADRSVSLDSVVERGTDFSGRRLDYFGSVRSRFEKCRFEKMDIRDACFGSGTRDSEYHNCSFDGSKLTSVAPGSARFVRCSFQNVLIRQLFCHRVEFIDCIFSGKLLTGYFNGTVPKDSVDSLGRQKNEFRGNDFSRMDLVDVAFRTGIDLAQQKLPAGPDYIYVEDGLGAVAEVRKQVIEWKDLELRQNGMIVIQLLELALNEGQQQLFLSTKGAPPKKLKKAMEIILSMLRQDDHSFPHRR